MPRELWIYGEIDHENIIRTFEILEIANRTYIFMELAEGGDLLDFIKVLIMYVIFFNNVLKLEIKRIVGLFQMTLHWLRECSVN